MTASVSSKSFPTFGGTTTRVSTRSIGEVTIAKHASLRDRIGVLIFPERKALTVAPFAFQKAGNKVALRSTELGSGTPTLCYPPPLFGGLLEDTDMTELTAERARELFDYDQSTGVLAWKMQPRKRYKPSLTAGYKRKDGYLTTQADGRAYLNHRIIWLLVIGSWPSEQVDHVNGIRNDNRIGNLREATHSANCENRRLAAANNPTRYLGVSLHKQSKKYQASIRVNGRQMYLGLFSTAEAAYAAYLTAKRQHHKGCTI